MSGGRRHRGPFAPVVEHKTGSDYSPGQLDGYAGDLDASFDGKRRLITIVDNAADAGPHDPRWDVLTWREVAVMAWQEGRDVGGMWWRVEAMDPAAPARLRLLHELLTYLEEEHHAVTDPLSHLHIVAFQNANNASDALIGVLERAADRSGLEPDGGHQWDKNDLGWYWQHFKLPGGWQAALEGNAELVVAEADSWAYDRTEEAAFGAGLTVPDSYYTALRESSRQPWRSELEAKGFVVSSNDDGWVRMYRTLYCAELLSKGSTVDAQAKFLGEWATEAIEFLAAHPPAPTLGP